MDPEPTESPPPTPPTSHISPITLISLALVLLLAVSTAYLAYQNWQLRQQLTKSKFALAESTPAPSPSSPTKLTATPTLTVPSTWKAYTNTAFDYSIQFPSTAKALIAESGNIAASSNANRIEIIGLVNPSMPYPYGVITIRGYNSKPSDPPSETNSNVTVNGIPATQYESPNEGNVTYVIATPKNQFIEILFTYGPADPIINTFNQILSTLTFVDQVTPLPTKAPSTGYTCPANGWVDCMPILTPEAQKACTQEAMAWYKANCPNFQGGAY